MRVAVSGGSGFIGRHVVRALADRGDEPVVLTRDTSAHHPGLDPRARLAGWSDGAPEWPSVLEGVDAVVNLAGETLAQRWTAKVKQRIAASRAGSLEKLGAGLRATGVRPKALVSASAIGYYGPRDDERLDETAPAGSDFLARTCVAWEEAARALEPLVDRLAILRFGFVLGRDGGGLPKMLPAFRAGFGTPVGTGRQYVSFIHVEDLARLVLFALDEAPARGALNATAPEPVTMDEFARALQKALGRPAFVPEFLGRLGSSLVLPVALGEMSTVVLDGQRAVPARARKLAFTWKHPDAESALAELLS